MSHLLNFLTGKASSTISKLPANATFGMGGMNFAQQAMGRSTTPNNSIFNKLPKTALMGLGMDVASSVGAAITPPGAVPQAGFVGQVNPYAANPYNVNPYSVNPYDENEAAFRAMTDVAQQAVTLEAQNQDALAEQAVLEAQADAVKTAREANQFRAQQAVDYSNSGVYLPGSPSALLTLNETRKLAEQEVNARISQGNAVATLYRNRGLQGQLQGRASLLGQQMQWNSEKSMYTAKSLQNDMQRDLYNTQGSIFDINQNQNMFETQQKNNLARGLQPGRASTAVKSITKLVSDYFGF